MARKAKPFANFATPQVCVFNPMAIGTEQGLNKEEDHR
jgi:hypothetical protein